MISITRKKFYKLLPYLNRSEAIIITGARQTGKSTLLKQLHKHLFDSSKECVLLNLERQNILQNLNDKTENLLNYISQELIRQPTDKTYVFIDEIQYLNNPSHFIKLIQDEYSDRIKLIVTGSSAFYIDHKFNDSLAGRKFIFELKPLDFQEFLLFKNQTQLLSDLELLIQGKIQKSVHEDLLWNQLEEYLLYGSYPAVVLEPERNLKLEKLKDLRDSFIKRDILESGIDDEAKFYQLFQILASQIGQLLNTNELANSLNLTHAATEHYLYIMQKCFHIKKIKPFHKNLRKELTKMPKFYFNDTGLRNILLNYFEPLEQRVDKGQLLENLVYRLLSDQYDFDNIKFWRTADGNEVDFIVQQNFKSSLAIEVKFQQDVRTIRKYKKFQKTYPEIPLNIISWKDERFLSGGF